MNSPRQQGITPIERARLLGLVLLLVALVAYANSFAGQFVFDDLRDIVDAGQRGRLEDLPALLGSNRPLVNLTLGLNYAVGELNPVGYHLVNLLIHMAAGLVLFGLVRRTALLWATKNDPAPIAGTAGVGQAPTTNPTSPAPGSSQGGKEAAAEKWAAYLAFASALLWVVHPLQTQAVTYIIQRAESLAALGYLLTLYALVRAAQGRHARAWSITAIIACALGMTAKPVVATAPLAAYLFDAVFLAGSWAAPLRRRWPLYLGLAAAWGILLATLGFGGELFRQGGQVGFALKAVTPLEYAMAQPGVILHYLRLVVWPAGQCLDYHRLPSESPLWAIPIVLVLLLASLYGLRRRRPWGFLGLAFFLILAPTSSFAALLDLAVEHRMYLPLAALCVLAAVAVSWVLRRFPAAAPTAGAATALLAAVLAVPLVVATISRNRIYHDDRALWKSVAQLRPKNPRAHSNYGLALYNHNQIIPAIAEFDRAIQLLPDYPKALANRGRAYHDLDLFTRQIRNVAAQTFPVFPRFGSRPPTLFLAQALTDLHASVNLVPEDPEAHHDLGQALRDAGQLGLAVAEFRRAIDLDPTQAAYHADLGAALAAGGAPRNALDPLLQAAKMYSAELLRKGVELKSAEDVARTLQLHPDAVPLCRNLARVEYGLTNAYWELKQFPDAGTHAVAFLRLDPTNAEVQHRYGLIEARFGAVPLIAVNAFAKAYVLRPQNAQYRGDLLQALDDWDRMAREHAAAGRYSLAVTITQSGLQIAQNCPGLEDRAAYLAAKLQEYSAKAAKAGPFTFPPLPTPPPPPATRP